jgi:hypothetical protein
MLTTDFQEVGRRRGFRKRPIKASKPEMNLPAASFGEYDPERFNNATVKKGGIMKRAMRFIFVLILLYTVMFTACGGGGGGGGDNSAANVVNTGGSGSGTGGGNTTTALYSDFNFSLAKSAYWEFSWNYDNNTWAQGSASSGKIDNGTFRVTLGDPKTIEGVTAYEITITGDSIDVDDYNYAPRWKWVAVDQNKILGSTNGTALEVIFDANTGSWSGGGFFATLSASSKCKTSTGTIANNFINTKAIVVGRSLSQTACETILGYTVCPNDSTYSLFEREYHKGGIGPVGYYFYYAYSFSGGGFSSGGSTERKIGLVATSFTAADGFVPNYPWSQKTTIPSTRTDYSVASLNNKIYVMGGKISSTVTSSIDVYDPATNTWTTGGSLPVSMYGQMSQTVNGKIYVFGGYQRGSTGYQLTTYESDTSATTWTPKAAMPSAFQTYSYLKSAASSTLIFLPVPDTNYYHTRCYAYDVASNQWISFTEKPSGYDNGSFVAWSGNSFYILGGWASGILETIYVSANWRVDPQPIGVNDIWTSKALMPVGRYSATSSTLNSNIYVMGGTGKSGTLDRVDMYDPVADKWTNKSPLPMPGSSLSSLVCNGKIYVIMPGNGRIYEYDPAKD